jgi:hypothetical protein
MQVRRAADECGGLKLTASAIVVYAKQGEAAEFALTQQKATDSAAEGTPRRFHVELFIVHPTLSCRHLRKHHGIRSARGTST